MSILVLDYGTSALKTVVYDSGFNMLACVSRTWVYAHPSAGWAELDPGVYWDMTVSAIQEVSQACGTLQDVEALSITGQAETLIPISADGQPLGNAIVWFDTRAQSQCDYASSQFPAEKLYAITGNPGFDPIMPLNKILWMKENQSDRFRKVSKFLLLKDYVLMRLTGIITSEVTANCCSGYFDITKRCWDNDLLGLAGIDAEKLPELVEPSEIIGRLTHQAASTLGLTDGIPVIAGLLDQCASVLGSGNIRQGMISETTGTALAIATTLDSFGSVKHLLVKQPIPVFIHALPGRFIAMPNCSAAGSLLTWFRNNFLSDMENADRAYTLINREVLNRLGNRSELLMIPHFCGRLSPVNCSAARGSIHGLTLDTDRFDIARALMESIAFMLRENLDTLARIGATAHEAVALGGGARSPALLQIKADVCNLPMVTLRVSESTAYGCAINAALALKILPDEDAIAPIISRDAVVKPEGTRRLYYDQRYDRYLKLNTLLGYD